MSIKEFIVNTLVAILGLVVICLGVGYIWWFGNIIEETKETFINVILVSLGYIIPTVTILGLGFLLFMKTLMDPWESKDMVYKIK